MDVRGIRLKKHLIQKGKSLPYSDKKTHPPNHGHERYTNKSSLAEACVCVREEKGEGGRVGRISVKLTAPNMI